MLEYALTLNKNINMTLFKYFVKNKTSCKRFKQRTQLQKENKKNEIDTVGVLQSWYYNNEGFLNV